MLPDIMRTRGNSQPYAAPSDFCHIFSERMNTLFLLSFLLTADQQMAEQCFASALNDCRGASGIFKKWAYAWARRAIIENAIGLLRPAPDRTSAVPHHFSQVPAIPGHSDGALLTAVTALTSFERFVFVMSVLESYSDQECRILLGCLRHEVIETRARALEHIGTSAQTVLSGTKQLSRAAAATAKASFVA